MRVGAQGIREATTPACRQESQQHDKRDKHDKHGTCSTSRFPRFSWSGLAGLGSGMGQRQIRWLGFAVKPRALLFSSTNTRILWPRHCILPVSPLTPSIWIINLDQQQVSIVYLPHTPTPPKPDPTANKDPVPIVVKMLVPSASSPSAPGSNSSSKARTLASLVVVRFRRGGGVVLDGRSGCPESHPRSWPHFDTPFPPR